MGNLSFKQSYQGGVGVAPPSTRRPPPLFGGGTSGFQPPSALEKFNLTDYAANVVGELGMTPARIYETPFAIGNVASGGALERFVSQVPILRDVVKGAGDAIMAAGNFMPSLINSEDARVWGAVGNLPDNTEISGDLLRARGLPSVAGEQTGGIPIIANLLEIAGLGTGPGGRNKTVGEFRDELTKRGFFYSTTGEFLDPAGVAAQIASGSRGANDFGWAAINDDALVDVLGRLTLDPTNLLFLTGVGGAARIPGIGATLARLGGRAATLSRLERAGLFGARGAPSARASGEMILRQAQAGQAMARAGGAASLGAGKAAAYATLRGVGSALRAYQKGAIASWAGNLAVNRVTGLANTLTGGQVAPLMAIEEFTDAVENDKPLSQNAAFMLLAAGTFPYRRVYQGARAGVGDVRTRILGHGDLDPVYRMYPGGRAEAIELHGGQKAFNTKMDLVDTMIVADREGMLGLLREAFASVPEMADRRHGELRALGVMVDTARARGDIKPVDRVEMIRKWHEENGGFVVRDQFTGEPREIRGVMPFDPIRDARQWAQFYHGQRRILQPILDATGHITAGERNVPLRHEYDLAQAVAKQAIVYEVRNGKKVAVVPVDTMLGIMDIYPNLHAFARRGADANWWSRWGKGDTTAPTWASVRAKLDAGKRKVDTHTEHYAQMANIERAAPEDIVSEFVRHRALRPAQEEVNAARSAIEDAGGGPPDVKTQGTIDKLHALADDPAASLNEGRVARAKAFLMENRGVSDELRSRLDSAQTRLREQQEIHQAQRLAGTGMDPRVYQQVLDHAAQFSGLDAAPFLDTSIKYVDSVEATLLGILEREMSEKMPAYQIKGLPGTDYIKDVPPNLQVPIRERSSFGRAVFQTGFFSPIGKFLSAATRPIGGFELRRGVERSMKEQFLPLGWSSGMVDSLIARLQKETESHSFVLDKVGPVRGGPIHVKAFRDINSFFPRTVEAIASEIVDGSITNKAARAKVHAQMKARGGAYRIVSSASSRYYRTLQAKATGFVVADRKARAAEGRADRLEREAQRVRADVGKVKTRRAQTARLERADAADAVAAKARAEAETARLRASRTQDKAAGRLLDAYNGWMGRRNLSSSQRVMARFIYPLFRFSLDPRWLLLNFIEGDIISSTQFGVRGRYAAMSEASRAGQHFSDRALAATDPDLSILKTTEGMNLNAVFVYDHVAVRNIEDAIIREERAGHAAQAAKLREQRGELIDAETRKVIDTHGQTNEHLSMLRAGMVREAETLRAEATRLGDKSEAATLLKQAEYLESQTNAALSTYLMDQMYRYERQGPRRTIDQEVRKQLTLDEARTMAPLLERLHEVNRQTWHDVRQAFYGNAERSTVERLMNSYWLFWPISYQIKATKWMANIMLDGSFGHNTHALGAGLYANWQNQHNERMKNNPAYAALYQANPMLWFTAQMLLPMTPDSMGVSLSRFTKMLAAQGEDAANELGIAIRNEWLSTVNVFTTDALLDDPTRSVEYLTNIGPLLTLNLLTKLQHDLDLWETQRTPFVPASRRGSTSNPSTAPALITQP